MKTQSTVYFQMPSYIKTGSLPFCSYATSLGSNSNAEGI